MALAPTPPTETRHLRSGETELAGDDRQRLTVTLSFDGPECMLVLAGDLSSDSVIALESQFDQLVSGGVDRVVLDVDGLQAVDNAGIGALARLEEVMGERHMAVSLRSERWPHDACSAS